MFRTGRRLLCMSVALVGAVAACSRDTFIPTAPAARDVQPDATAPSVAPIRVGLGRPDQRTYVILAGNIVTNAKGRSRQADAREVVLLRRIAAKQPMIDRLDTWLLAYEKAHPRTAVAVSGAASTMAPSTPLFTDAPERDGDPCVTAGLDLYNATQSFYGAAALYKETAERLDACMTEQLWQPQCTDWALTTYQTATDAGTKLDLMLDAANTFTYFGCMIG
jgi:hypothetical protein